MKVLVYLVMLMISYTTYLGERGESTRSPRESPLPTFRGIYFSNHKNGESKRDTRVVGRKGGGRNRSSIGDTKKTQSNTKLTFSFQIIKN